MTNKPKQTFRFSGTCVKTKLLRTITVSSDSIITADKAAKARLENPRMTGFGK